jgi:hypothetical protein
MKVDASPRTKTGMVAANKKARTKEEETRTSKKTNRVKVMRTNSNKTTNKWQCKSRICLKRMI